MSKRQIAVTYGPFPEAMFVTDIQPGDEWTSDREMIRIEGCEWHTATDEAAGFVRLHGRIMTGPDRSPKVLRQWTFVIDQELMIVRKP